MHACYSVKKYTKFYRLKKNNNTIFLKINLKTKTNKISFNRYSKFMSVEYTRTIYPQKNRPTYTPIHIEVVGQQAS